MKFVLQKDVISTNELIATYFNYVSFALHFLAIKLYLNTFCWNKKETDVRWTKINDRKRFVERAWKYFKSERNYKKGGPPIYVVNIVKLNRYVRYIKNHTYVLSEHFLLVERLRVFLMILNCFLPSCERTIE